MKASHQFHICMLLWAGILDLEMTFYHWQEQVGIVNRAIILVDPAGSDIATLQQLSEIGAYENKEPKPWLPIIPSTGDSFLTLFQTLRRGRLPY
jgi:hypothetical protein